MYEDNLFPLSLTNFEAAVLADDRPAYPMSVIYRMRFKGFLELAALQAAVETVVRREPFLRAVISPNWLGKLVWIASPNRQPEIQRHAQITPSGFPHMTHYDPTQESGFRWWILERDDGHDVVLQGHHCCADGIMLNAMAEDLLVSYALNQSGQTGEATLHSLNVQRLLRRGAPKLNLGNAFIVALKQIRGLAGVNEFLGRSPAPLMGQYSTISLSARTHDTFPAILSYEFDTHETEIIRTAAKSSSVTINTLLLRDLFLAIGAWRRMLGIGHSRDWIRITVPISLRGATDKTMPMSNSVSTIFPDRQAVDFEDKNRLLKSLHDQLGLIKRFELQYTYILSLGVARLIPGLIQLMTRADRCHSTTYLSNLGVILDQTPLPCQNGQIVCGNVVLQSVDIASILRPHTNAGFVAYSYCGKLRLTLQYDPHVIQSEQAGDLLNAYVWQIRQTLSKTEGG